jgi:periplasmic protein CpxP/Spy
MKLSVPFRTLRPARAAGLTLACVVASGVALAAWAAAGDPLPHHRPPPMMMGGFGLPHGPMLDHVLDDAAASPTQRAQVHQIVDAADVELRAGFAAERADHDQMVQLFSQPSLDAAAIEAVRARIEARHDAASKRATQAMIDVGLVLSADQRRLVTQSLAAGPRPFGGPHPAAPAVNE